MVKSEQKVVEGEVWFRLTRQEIIYSFGIDADLLQSMEEEGICAPVAPNVYDDRALARIRTALRLQRDLGVNLPGIALVLELLAELERLRSGSVAR